MQTILASGGMRDWTPGEWITLMGALAGFMTITLVPFLYKLLDIFKQLRTLTEKTAIADTKAESAQQTAKDNTAQIIDIAKCMPPPRQPNTRITDVVEGPPGPPGPQGKPGEPGERGPSGEPCP